MFIGFLPVRIANRRAGTQFTSFYMESKEDTVRTFIAVPASLSGPLQAARDRLRQRLSSGRIRWIPESQLHFTLLFIGETRVSMLKTVASALRESLEGASATTLTYKGIGIFGQPHAPRVLWTGVTEKEILRDIQQRVTGELETILPLPGSFHFKPHLTLARIKSLPGNVRMKEIIAPYYGKELGAVALDRVRFYRSDLHPSGARYRVLEEISLG